MSAWTGEDRRVVERWEPASLSPIRLLEDVAPHRLPDVLVDLARHEAGCPIALYVIDIGGSALCKVAGDESLPDEVEIGQGVGPELGRGRMGEVQGLIEQAVPGAVAIPLWLYGRAVAVFMTAAPPTGDIEPLARQAAAAVELADRYTDVFSAARRREATTPAAEIQENILPARIVYYEGIQLSAGLVPAYSIGGDWYDHADNRDGVWVAVADAVGKGPRAAALSTVALGALRAARRSGMGIERAVGSMNDALLELGYEEGLLTALVAHWDRTTERLRCVRLGHPPPLLVTDGEAREWGELGNPPLGVLDELPELVIDEVVLEPGDLFVAYSDGVLERRCDDGSLFGLEGAMEAITASGGRSAYAAARALIVAVLDAGEAPPHDDATVLVLQRT